MKSFRILLCLLSVFLLCSCESESDYQSQAFFAMDTFSEIRLYSETESAEDVLAQSKQLIDEIETAISVTKEGGDAYRLNAEGVLTEPSPYLAELLEISEEISKATDGCFDVRTGAMIALWQQCEEEQRLPMEEELSAAVALVNTTVLTDDSGIEMSDTGLALNFGAIGKGYAADLVVEQLRAAGVSCGMVSFVSSVTVFGERSSGKDFRVAIRTPDTSGNYLGYVTLKDCSLSVSGNYERYYEIGGETYCHILDPETGMPVDNGILSVVVIAESAAYADALSTAITVMGAEKTFALYREGALAFEGAIVTENEVLMTDGFSDLFSTVSEDYDCVLLSERFE